MVLLLKTKEKVKGWGRWGPAKVPASQCACVCQKVPFSELPISSSLKMSRKETKSLKLMPIRDFPRVFWGLLTLGDSFWTLSCSGLTSYRPFLRAMS